MDGVHRGPRLRVCVTPPSVLLRAPSRTRSVHGEGDENEMRTVMEELSAVGEQVFDAECILNKRLRKVRNTHTNTHTRESECVRDPQQACLISTGQTGVSGQVERMVVQVSEN